MNGNVIRTITIQGRAEGLDKLTADVNKLAAAQENVAVVSEQSAKRVLSLEDAWKRQTLRLDEAARAQHNIARETKVADAALKEGLATQAQHAQRLDQINQRYTKTADATKVVTQQTGLARHELVNLGRQAQDVGVSLMSGQSPFTVLVQQGTQIADVFATSGGSIRGFFSQAVGWAKGFFTSTMGIVTAIGAVGAAAIYAASQFRTASTTMEQALEKANKLLKEGKTLLDAKASAEDRAFAKSKELVEFEAKRDRRDLESKIGPVMRDAENAARRRSTRPTQVAGEMGEAPTGVATLGPGYERIKDAADKLNAAMVAGLPGLRAYQSELAKIAAAHPELEKTVEELLKIAEGGIQAEITAQKLRATEDALKGVATNAQLASIGFASMAQFNLSNLQAPQAAAATERMAQATLRMAAQYPGMSIEVAKQLQALEDQVKLNDARVNGTEELVQAEIAYTNAIAKGTTELEAQAIKNATRRVAESSNQKTALDFMNEAEAELGNVGDEIQNNTVYMQQFSGEIDNATFRMRNLAWWAQSVGDAIANRLDMLPTQFEESSGGSFQIGPGGWIQDFVATIDARNKALGYDKSKNDNLLVDSIDDLIKSTDSLNATMQNALSPFYSQDPRTTKLGFRAGVIGNPDWMTGATNANPLVALLGAGATAPGMANGGSFTVAGGYSANDNAMAMFPVASGEQVVVNRNPQGRGGEVINIDNRIIITGTVDDDALSKMKVSRYQQTQRMRAGMARV